MRTETRVGNLLLPLIVLLCSGCSSIEGVFEPACIAYEGDEVILKDDRFEWSRFTDMRTVDDEGNEVDPFPAYPKIGRYAVNSGRVEFHAEDGKRLEDHFLYRHDDVLYLLTHEQNDAVMAGKGLPDCPLRRID